MLFNRYFELLKKYSGFVVAYVLVGVILLIIDLIFGPKLVYLFSQFQGVERPVLILTPFYLQVTISLIIIYAGFFSERYRDRMKRLDDVDKILPLIDFELRCNYEFIKSTVPVLIHSDEFYTDYWDIYKTDLRGWEHTNIVPLTEIYGLMNKYKPEKDVVFSERLKMLIKNQLDVYKIWYSDEGKNKAGESARNKKMNVIDQFKRMAEKGSLSDRQYEVVLEMERELKEINKKIRSSKQRSLIG